MSHGYCTTAGSGYSDGSVRLVVIGQAAVHWTPACLAALSPPVSGRRRGQLY